MKVEIYGPQPYEFDHMVNVLKLIPEGSKSVIVQAPLRRASDLRACQRPDTLEYAASIDNSVFVHYSHHPIRGTTVKIT